MTATSATRSHWRYARQT